MHDPFIFRKVIMNKHDLIMLSIGALSGAVITGVGAYLVYRQYVPLNKLNDSINELESRKRELLAKIEQIQNSYDSLSESTKRGTARMDKELDFYESQLDAVKEELKQNNQLVADQGNPDAINRDEAYYAKKFEETQSTDENYSDDYETDRSSELERGLRSDDAEEQSEKEIAMTKRFFGRYVINDGNKRWDGPLTDDEQAEYDNAGGDPDIENSILMNIKEERFINSIDEKEPMYQISEQEHHDMPEFLDTEELDYYEVDDILALGRDIVPNPSHLIDLTVLNHFGKNSMSSDPNVVYCRNDELETDYIVTRHTGSFQNEVLGIPDEDSRVVPRKFNKELADDMEETRGRNKR